MAGRAEAGGGAGEGWGEGGRGREAWKGGDWDCRRRGLLTINRRHSAVGRAIAKPEIARIPWAVDHALDVGRWENGW